MTLSVLLQMDPMTRINMAGDSTVRLGREAERRGYRVFHTTPDLVHYDDGVVKARISPISFSKEGDPPAYQKGQPVNSLLKDLDVILLRQDPPFDLHYIANTHLLELVHPRPLVVNDPVAVRNAPEKLVATKFPEVMPPTMITSDPDLVAEFRQVHGDIVIKPLYGHAGNGIISLKADDPGLGSLLGLYAQTGREPLMIQKFLPQVVEGDKRILMVDGEPVAVFRRRPARGEIRANMVHGGTPVKSELSHQEREICERVGPMLREEGLLFVGLDTIGDYLTEINTTSPTGLGAADMLYGMNTAGLVWDAIETHLQK